MKQPICAITCNNNGDETEMKAHTDIDLVAEKKMQLTGNNNMSWTARHVVDHQHGKRREGGKEKFVSPSQVEYVIAESEQNRRTNTDQTR